MLPGSTERRKERDGIKKDGRGVEIQRLIGRFASRRMRSDPTGRANDLHRLRRASGRRRHAHRVHHGAFAALTLACDKLMKRGLIDGFARRRQVAA